jgi:hypothetical protein
MLTPQNVHKDGPQTLSRSARLEAAVEGKQNDMSVADWAALLSDVRSGIISQEDLKRIIHSPGAQIDFILQAAAVERLLSSISIKGFTEKQVRELLGNPTKANSQYLLYKYTDSADSWAWTMEFKNGVVSQVISGEL